MYMMYIAVFTHVMSSTLVGACHKASIAGTWCMCLSQSARRTCRSITCTRAPFTPCPATLLQCLVSAVVRALHSLMALVQVRLRHSCRHGRERHHLCGGLWPSERPGRLQKWKRPATCLCRVRPILQAHPSACIVGCLVLRVHASKSIPLPGVLKFTLSYLQMERYKLE